MKNLLFATSSMSGQESRSVTIGRELIAALGEAAEEGLKRARAAIGEIAPLANA